MADSSSPQNIIRGTRHQGKAMILELGGEIDMKCSAALKAKFAELYKQNPQVLVVNMEKVEFLDSSGLASLVGALKWCRQNDSEFKLAGLCKRVKSIFEICKLESIFQIYDSEDEALS